jgi:LacI family transcriptional regulator
MVPDGTECLVATAVPKADTAAGRKRLKQVMTDWLAGLLKPVGILTLETGAAAFLLEHCRRLKLRVPQDVQIIGIDSADHCLACEPRLSSLELPNRRIGEMALQTLLRWMQQEQPPPGPVIRVGGCRIVARGTTGLVEAGHAILPNTLDIMQAHAADGMTASQAARLSGVGRTTLYKEFAQATGVTPARYLRRQRLENACRELRETSDSVTEIAGRCGFKSLVAFIRFFRRHMDTTPTAYRRQARRKV